MIRPGIRRFFSLALRRRALVQRAVRDEIAFHLEERAVQLEHEGWSPDEARAEAARRFGSANAYRQLEHAAQQREQTMSLREAFYDWTRDLRYAARGLRRDGLFTSFAIVTLALGIGANAAMYGIVDRLLLRGPAHVREPDRVIRFALTVTLPKRGDITSSTLGYVSYLKLREATRLFAGVAAYKVDRITYGRGESARLLRAGYATADFFPLLGVRAARGRFFAVDEDRTTGAERVVVLSDGFWRNEFGADPSIIGRTISIQDATFTVVGVAPKGFTGVELSRVDFWLPMSLTSATTNDWTRSWQAQWLHVVGRLRPGVTRDAASDDATSAHRRTYDGDDPVWAQARMWAAPIRFTESGREPREIVVSRWLFGVTLVVLVIACTNVANLLLARAIRRRREVAVQLALGIARARLARLFVTESLLLAFAGGIAALVVAYTLASVVRSSVLSDIEWTSSPVSGRILAVSAMVVVIIGIVIGLVPALHAVRRSVMGVMKAGAEGDLGRQIRVRAWPMVIQSMLATALLIGAGLFMRSLQRAQSIHLGFDGDRVLVAEARWARRAAPSTSDGLTARRVARLRVYMNALERVRRILHVENAAIAVGSPFGNSFTVNLFVPGLDSLPILPGGGPYVSAVSSDYFATTGTRLVRGRVFAPSEGIGSTSVAVVNTTMAAALWPGRDALGQCLRVGADTAPCAQVVGIVEPARRYQLREPPSMQYYIPVGQELELFGGNVLMVRAPDPAAVAPAVRAALAGLDPMVEMFTTRPLQESIEPLIRPWRLGTTIFGLGGVLALLVAAIGLYSVMSYTVAQRTHEVGVRIALGARSTDIMRLVVGQGVALAAAGVALGVGIASYAGRFLQQVLFDTSARDPYVFVVAAAVLIVVAVLASFTPALRAVRVDPMRALRQD